MLFSLAMEAGCGRAEGVVGFGPTREERCLRHRELDGHATPGWVLQSAERRSWLTCSRGVS